jgi:hypothetical protein
MHDKHSGKHTIDYPDRSNRGWQTTLIGRSYPSSRGVLSFEICRRMMSHAVENFLGLHGHLARRDCLHGRCVKKDLGVVA